MRLCINDFQIMSESTECFIVKIYSFAFTLAARVFKGPIHFRKDFERMRRSFKCLTRFLCGIDDYRRFLELLLFLFPLSFLTLIPNSRSSFFYIFFLISLFFFLLFLFLYLSVLLCKVVPFCFSFCLPLNSFL